MVRTLNLDGDRQADLTVHGGAAKAVYAYPSEHYAYWRSELPALTFDWGAFGENLTTAGLDEDLVHIGDQLRVGQAEFVVTQPRLPCVKLGVRFGIPDMVRRFLASRRTGFYLAVQREGLVAAGDPITVIARDKRGVRVTDFTRVYAFEPKDQDTLRRIIAVPALPEGWRTRFTAQLAALAGERVAH
jgi:MOSC domain-containing protein YiiM